MPFIKVDERKAHIINSLLDDDLKSFLEVALASHYTQAKDLKNEEFISLCENRARRLGMNDIADKILNKTL